MDLTPSKTAMLVGLVMLAGLVSVLLVFLAITWWLGDPTNHLEENQPTPGGSSVHLVLTPGTGRR